jgi:hypothetical protein
MLEKLDMNFFQNVKKQDIGTVPILDPVTITKIVVFR